MKTWYFVRYSSPQDCIEKLDKLDSNDVIPDDIKIDGMVIYYYNEEEIF